MTHMENKSNKREESKTKEENMIREMLEFYTLVPPSPHTLKRMALNVKNPNVKKKTEDRIEDKK